METDFRKTFYFRSDDFNQRVTWWFHTFQIDYWYRKKYNIAFGSKRHNDVAFEDILHEFMEDHLIESYAFEYKKQLIEKQEEENNSMFGDDIQQEHQERRYLRKRKNAYRNLDSETLDNLELSDFNQIIPDFNPLWKQDTE